MPRDSPIGDNKGMAEERPSRDQNEDVAALVPEADEFYYEGPYLVFTAAYHLRRGYCCQSGCRHCPYGLDTQKSAD